MTLVGKANNAAFGKSKLFSEPEGKLSFFHYVHFVLFNIVQIGNKVGASVAVTAQKKKNLFAPKDLPPSNEGTINTKLALTDLEELFGSPSDDKVCF